MRSEMQSKMQFDETKTSMTLCGLWQLLKRIEEMVIDLDGIQERKKRFHVNSQAAFIRSPSGHQNLILPMGPLGTRHFVNSNVGMHVHRNVVIEKT